MTMTIEMINAKMEQGKELTQADMEFISQAIKQPITYDNNVTEEVTQEVSANYEDCLNDAYKVLHGEYYPQLDNISNESVENIVEMLKDEMCVLVENINWGESRHRKVPVVLQRKYDKFMSKWDKEEFFIK